MWAELCGRSHHGKHHIRARVCRKRCQRRFHLIGPRAGKRHVNHPPMMWQVSGGKAGHGSGIGRAGFNADNAQSIHRHSATATRGGHDRNGAARIGERLPPNEQGRRFQQRFNHGHARNAIGAEEGIRRRIRPRQRASMAARQFCPEAGTAKLEGNDGLAQRMGAVRGGGEFFRRANRFQKQQHRIHAGVFHQHAGDFTRGQISFIAGADKMGKAHAARRTARHDSAHHGTGLRNQGDAPGGQAFGFQRRIH